jgi:hypothetical protein
MRSLFASVVVAVGLIAFVATPSRSADEAEKAQKAAEAEQAAQAAKNKKVAEDEQALYKARVDKLPPATSTSLRRLLSEKVKIPDPFRAAPVALRIVLGYLDFRTVVDKSESLPIVFDKKAFKDDVPDAFDSLLDTPIEFSTFANSLTYRQVLEHSIRQLPADATFLIRDGLVVILPGAAAKIDRLLQRKIAVEFRGKPLVATLDELADLSGISIAIDPRSEEMQKKTVDARFSGDVSVRGILDSLADLHDLKILVSADRVAVLPQSVYLKRLRDRGEETRLLRETEAVRDGAPTAPAPAPPKTEK